MNRTTSSRYHTGHLLQLFLAAILAMLLAACGGGGGNSASGCVTIDPSRDPNLPGCSTGTGATAPRMTVALTDSANAPITTISNDRPGNLVAVFRNGANAAVADTVVTFTTTDATGVFVPAAGTAVTDATGTARVGLPVGTTAGAVSYTHLTLPTKA